VPSFNFRGTKSIGSVPGFVYTIVTVLVCTFYAGKRAELLFMKNNPTISETVEEGILDESHAIDLKR
jgi:hypothetical protein